MLPKVKTIVYACDLDGKTQDAMGWVLNLALQNQAKVIILHVMEPMNSQAEGMMRSYLPADTIKNIRAESYRATQEKMQQQLNEYMALHTEELAALTIPPETLLVTGIPFEAIQKAAQDHHADLIAMNSRTHSRFGQMLIGSTANKVIHQSHIPVLVVPIK